MSGGKGGNTGSTKVAPWKEAAPYAMDAMQGAYDLWQANSPGAYGGQTVAGLNSWQEQSFTDTYNRADQGNLLNPLSQYAMANQLTGPYNPAADYFNQYAQNPQAGAYQALPYAYNNLGMAEQQNPAMGMLMGSASGGFLNSNPYIDQAYGQAAGEMTDQYQRGIEPFRAAAMSRAGRLGSPSDVETQSWGQEGLSHGLADLASKMYSQNYGNERQLMQNAQGQIGGLWNQGFGNQLAATGQLGQLANLGLGGQAGLFAGLGQQYQQDQSGIRAAIGATPGLTQADYFDMQQMAGAGGALQQQQQQELGAEQQRWMEQMYGPGSAQQWLNQYTSQISPFAGLGSFTQSSQPSTMQGIAGGALIGGALGAGMGPLTWGGAPLAGGLAGPTMGGSIAAWPLMAGAGALMGGLL